MSSMASAPQTAFAAVPIDVSDQAQGPETWENFDVTDMSRALSAVEDGSDDMKVEHAAFSFAAGDPSRPAFIPSAPMPPAFQFAAPPSEAAPQAPPASRVPKRRAPVGYDPMDISTHGIVFKEMGQMLIDIVDNPRLVTDQQSVYTLADIAATKKHLLKQSRGRPMGEKSRERRRNFLSTIDDKLTDLLEKQRLYLQMKPLDVAMAATERQLKVIHSFGQFTYIF